MFLMIDLKWCMQMVSPFLLRLICIEFLQALRNDSLQLYMNYITQKSQSRCISLRNLNSFSQVRKRKWKILEDGLQLVQKKFDLSFWKSLSSTKVESSITAYRKWKVFEYGLQIVQIKFDLASFWKSLSSRLKLQLLHTKTLFTQKKLK